MAPKKTIEDKKYLYTIREVLDQVQLSRARFYQLLTKGVFPPPVYCIDNRRPCYTLEQFILCKQIRQTGIDFQGHPVLFNQKKQDRNPIKSRPDRQFQELTDTLKSFGIKTTALQVQKAISQLFTNPKAIDPSDREVITRLVDFFEANKE